MMLGSLALAGCTVSPVSTGNGVGGSIIEGLSDCSLDPAVERCTYSSDSVDYAVRGYVQVFTSRFSNCELTIRPYGRNEYDSETSFNQFVEACRANRWAIEFSPDGHYTCSDAFRKDVLTFTVGIAETILNGDCAVSGLATFTFAAAAKSAGDSSSQNNSGHSSSNSFQ
jgi:hypothetical protein